MPQIQPITIARPRMAHAREIHGLITYWAARTPVLPKSLGDIYENLREFVLAMEGDLVVGCAAMHIDWADLAEIRSVAVRPGYQGRGIGQLMVNALIAEAADLGLGRVFCLTDRPTFFARMGFTVIDRGQLPHKVWRDCQHCPLFHACTEIAMGRDVTA